MAQKRLYNYKQPINSDDFAMGWLGVLSKGRYTGFDALANISGLDFEISHNLTGVVITNSALSQSNPTGSLITPQGQMVQEDANVALTAATNSGNGSDRNDLIIFEHEYVLSAGGVDGTYSIIQGPGGSTALPALTNPEKQIILGILTIPAGATDLSAATYTPSAVPLLGNADLITNFPVLDNRYARLAAYNTYTRRQGFPAATGSLLTELFGAVSGNYLVPVSDANLLIYPSGAGVLTINEILRTEDNSELIIYNASANNLTFAIGATPVAGGLAIGCAYKSGTIVLPTNAYIHLRQIAGAVYMVMWDSVTFANSVTAYNEWVAATSSWDSLALVHDNALDDVGDVQVTSAGPAFSVVNIGTCTFHYKVIGKTAFIRYHIFGTIDVASTSINLVLKMPFTSQGSEYIIKSSEWNVANAMTYYESIQILSTSNPDRLRFAKVVGPGDETGAFLFDGHLVLEIV